ncbi:Uncharacterized protein At5g08430 [Linum perenne]
MGKFGSKRKQFIGWCSKELFEFLASVGKDTSQQLTEHEVSDIIKRYSAENNLFHPERKKKILCDSKLYKLFSRNSVNSSSMHQPLKKHFADNQSDDDLGLAEELGWFVADDEQNAEVTCKKQRFSTSEAECQEKEAVPLARKSCFASVTTQNIKLVYLRRNVVEELSKESENFDAKVIGSFVRVKADPYDYSQKNSHLLVQVKGVRRTRQNGDSKDSILVQVSDMMGEIPICKLADENFTEEECQDLRRRVKDGLLKRPVVVEFKEKARILHEAITKDWIQRELVILERLISQANLKGWRKELSEYLERLGKLKNPEEQSRLLQEIPKVVADDEDVEPASEEVCRKDEQEVTESQEIAPNEATEVKKFTRGSQIYWCSLSGADVAGDKVGDISPYGPTRCIWSDKDAKSREEKSGNMKIDGQGDEVSNNFPSGFTSCGWLDEDDKTTEERSKTTKTDYEGDEVGTNCPSGVVASFFSEKVDEDETREEINKNTQTNDDQHQESHNTASETREDGMLQMQNQAAKKYRLHPEHQFLANASLSKNEQVELLKGLHDNGNTSKHPSGVEFIQLIEADDDVPASNNGGGSSVKAKNNQVKKPFADNVVVIELSDDEDDNDDCKQTVGLNGSKQMIDMNAKIWNCMNPSGVQMKGLFSMVLLRRWLETRTSPYIAQYKVWREDQSKEEAVVLDEAIRQAFGLRL